MLILFFVLLTLSAAAIFLLKSFNPKSSLPLCRTKFACLVAARNEQAVIGALCDSLNHLDYPRQLYDIIVILNNCTDQTGAVAVRHGAKVFQCVRPITSKGEALTEFLESAQNSSSYEAYVVFDADNLVEPHFLQEMDRAIAAGAAAAQGYRDVKNPDDSVISSCYNISFKTMTCFFHRLTARLRVSTGLGGCGMMITRQALEQTGGFHTFTLTEDLEYTMQLALNGVRVDFVEGAIFYDEQPVGLGQSWIQRKRWATGSIQCVKKYWKKLTFLIFRGKKAPDRISALFLMIYAMAPLFQIVGLAFLTASLAYGITALLVNPIRFSLLAELCIIQTVLFYALTTGMSAFVLLAERSLTLRQLKGVLVYHLFLFCWQLIALNALLKPELSWKPLVHMGGKRLMLKQDIGLNG